MVSTIDLLRAFYVDLFPDFLYVIKNTHKNSNDNSYEALNISIHVPTWGATLLGKSRPNDADIFQSTHPRGVRREIACGDPITAEISIHAPTWGATVNNPQNQEFIHKITYS